VGVGSLVFGLAGTASAAPSASGSGGPAAGGSVKPADASASSAVAGYYVTPSIGISSASATFVVPKATCKANESGVGEFVGLFNLNPANGNVGATSLAAVDISCDSGVATYKYEVFIGGEADTPTGIKPGDTVNVSIAQTASTELDTVRDLTTNSSAALSGSPVSSAMSVGAYSTIPTEQTTKVTFTKVQINGQYLNAQPSTQYNLLNGAKTLIKTSGLASPGDTFSLAYKHAS
jgi:hypothetical protein